MKIRPRPLQMFSNFVGGFLTYFSNRWDISGSTLTLIKWVGLLTGIGGYLLGRLVANCFGHPYINIGVSAGGGARGLKNPFGGTSPFHMVLKAADKAGVQELVQLIRSTRRASQIGVISTELADAEEKDVENASRSTAVHLDLLDEKTASLQAEMREVEKAVLDEADMRMLAIRGVFKQLDVNADGSLQQKELEKAMNTLGLELSIVDLMKEYDTDKSGSLDSSEFENLMLDILEPGSEKNVMRSFEASQPCPLNFYAVALDWVPWGNRATTWTKADLTCEPGGTL